MDSPHSLSKNIISLKATPDFSATKKKDRIMYRGNIRSYTGCFYYLNVIII